MKEHIIEKAKQMAVKAKQNGDNSYTEKATVTLTSGQVSSLSDAVKTKEQADVFMTMLKSL